MGLCAAAALILPPSVAAQDEIPSPAAPDTAAADAPPADSTGRMSLVVRPEADTLNVPHGPSPMGAFFRSVLIPGWGQLAADQEVRAAFYFIMQSATVYMVLRTNHRIGQAESEALKQSRRDQREDWLVLAGFWALASGVDAWVSAHMWGFEGEVVPPPDGSSGLALRVRIPTRGF